MTAQWIAHRCHGVKAAGVSIEAAKVDGKVTEWQWVRKNTTRSGMSEMREYITHCPYCGKRLDE